MTAPRFANRELLTSAKLNLLSDAADLAGDYTSTGTGAVTRTVQDRCWTVRCPCGTSRRTWRS
jgi:hypothetical protein